MPYWMLIKLPFLGYQGCHEQTEHHFNLKLNEITIEPRWTSSQNFSLCSNYKRHLTEQHWRRPITPPQQGWEPARHVRDFSGVIIAIRNNSAWICNTDVLNRRRQTNQGKRPAMCFCWNETVLRELCLPIQPPHPPSRALVRVYCQKVSLSSLV